jgi:hypothetical protein
MASQVNATRWSVNARVGLTQYMLTALKGTLSVDAPWQGHYCRYIQADFQPDTDDACSSVLLKNLRQVGVREPIAKV